MTYNVNDPLPSDKIRNWPASVTTNEWPRLKAIIEADHKFDLSATTSQGFHKYIHDIKQTINPAIPAGADAIEYVSDGLKANLVQKFYKNSLGNFQLSPCMPVWAAVNFTIATSAGAITTNNSFNCSIGRFGSPGQTGRFQLTFNGGANDPVLNAFYYPLIIAQPFSAAGSCYWHLNPDFAITTNSFQFEIRGPGNSVSHADPKFCSVIVFGFQA